MAGSALDTLAQAMMEVWKQRMGHRMTLDTIMNQIFGYGLLNKFQGQQELERLKQANAGYASNNLMNAITEAMSNLTASGQLNYLNTLRKGFGDQYPEIASSIESMLPGIVGRTWSEAPVLNELRGGATFGWPAMSSGSPAMLGTIFPKQQLSSIYNMLTSRTSTPMDVYNAETARGNMLASQQTGGDKAVADIIDMTQRKLQNLETLKLKFLSGSFDTSDPLVMQTMMSIEKSNPELFSRIMAQGGENWLRQIGSDFIFSLSEVTSYVDSFARAYRGITDGMSSFLVESENIPSIMNRVLASRDKVKEILRKNGQGDFVKDFERAMLGSDMEIKSTYERAFNTIALQIIYNMRQFDNTQAKEK